MYWTPPVIWTVLGLALIALEALVPGLVLVFFGIGALITAACSFVFDLEASHQLVIFACSSVACLLLLRGWMRTLFHGRTRPDEEQVEKIESLVGEAGVVTEAIPEGGLGRIKLRGTFYTARSAEALAVGESVRVQADPRGDHSELVVARI